MFIPTWLLVLIVLVVLAMIRPGIWGGLGELAIGIFWLVCLVSIPASLYFFSQRDPIAWWVAVPWIAALLWSGLRFLGYTVRTSFVIHRLRIWAAPSPQAIECIRRNFAEAHDLGRVLWRFAEDVRHFPSWFNSKLADGTPWTSNVIERDDIRVFHQLDQIARFGVDSTALEGGWGECLAYRFTVNGAAYVLCSRRGTNADSFDIDGESLEVRIVWVIESPNRVMLNADLRYYAGEYADTFHDAHIHAFRPGPWMPALLEVAQRVQRDEREKFERWRKQSEREQSQKNFV